MRLSRLVLCEWVVRVIGPGGELSAEVGVTGSQEGGQMTACEPADDATFHDPDGDEAITRASLAHEGTGDGERLADTDAETREQAARIIETLEADLPFRPKDPDRWNVVVSGEDGACITYGGDVRIHPPYVLDNSGLLIGRGTVTVSVKGGSLFSLDLSRLQCGEVALTPLGEDIDGSTRCPAGNYEFRELALQWAARGAKVFRLMPGSTTPGSNLWREEATTNNSKIREWWPVRPEYPAVGLAVVNATGDGYFAYIEDGLGPDGMPIVPVGSDSGRTD